ncbi:hypothetical protein VFPPC_15498 [Pochonia chlamydosporia 170]|uniref:Uncharacterized protein n=1 Tax=Pochonia chlamydosporia 170 TaxID=1380566 RepID=A0A179FY23_METCM|nr:hypothetical protein VFPPC_15498 [Pochonia chlamydosporia 170]OAQ69859.1 hypothetical protein VFPPC_15498 [Pochonia chlamydosporia 170]
MQPVTKDDGGAVAAAHKHHTADDFKHSNLVPPSNTDKDWKTLERVLGRRRHQHRQTDGTSSSIGPASTYSTRDRARLEQKSDGPMIRPRSKTYLTATVLHSGSYSDSSMPTTISKDTTQGIEAKNRCLLATFCTKTKLFNPPLHNSPVIPDAARGDSSRRSTVAEKSDFDSGAEGSASLGADASNIVWGNASHSSALGRTDHGDDEDVKDMTSDDTLDAIIKKGEHLKREMIADISRQRKQARLARHQDRNKLIRRLQNLENIERNLERHLFDAHSVEAANATTATASALGLFDTHVSAAPRFRIPPRHMSDETRRKLDAFLLTAPVQSITQQSHGLPSSRLSRKPRHQIINHERNARLTNLQKRVNTGSSTQGNNGDDIEANYR